MRSLILLPLAAAIVLSGCQKHSGPPSDAEVKAKIQSMVKPQPGEYESTAKLIKFDVPGMPPAQAEQVRNMFASAAQGRKYCLTKEEADQGYEQATKKLAQGNCKFDRFDADGGHLDAKLSCQTEQKASSTVEMKGTMSPTGSDVNMKIDQAGTQLPGGRMNMEMQVTTKRVGDCQG